jgi:riboflavin synthase
VFTGIIKEVGRMEAMDHRGSGRALRIGTSIAPELGIDESVAVNGVCLTVVATDATSFSVIAIEETMSKTSLGTLEEGSPVNLERALLLPARLDGHLVQGHVDTTGVIVEVETLETSHLYRIRYPETWAAYLIPTGSITVDGISLTVARLGTADFTVAIIPYTFEHTNVRETWRKGARVNLEFDVLGKYVVRHLELSRRKGVDA